ncbi:MAG: hypothetical protein AXA67_00645 [Methylothermaceae bacteria B42]|nr:MAG: hypothetical protein AXA67_00645 [Methylothermaceae bacteria B42]HHJ38777.1 hypothetical protein [Methylothermaceae bacterium]
MKPTQNQSSADPEKDLELLADTIRRLTTLCLKLQRENQQLKQENNQLLSEQERVLSQTSAAKKRVETMLERLQALSPQT